MYLEVDQDDEFLIRYLGTYAADQIYFYLQASKTDFPGVQPKKLRIREEGPPQCSCAGCVPGSA